MMRPTMKSIDHADALGLPARGSALKAFAGLSDVARGAFLDGLLEALWDAEERNDLAPVQRCVAAWYADAQFDDLSKAASDPGMQLTQEEMLARLRLG